MTVSFLALALTTVLLIFVASAGAAPSKLNWGTQVNAGECETKGSPAVNVMYKVVNSVDSGEGGNYWAFSNYNKRIQVWDQGDGAFCAVVGYQGHFFGEEGQQSPGNTEPLDGNEDGTFHGGYRATVTGDLLAEPAWPVRGRTATIDHECTIAGVCPGKENWVSEYFQAGSVFNYEWWGWIYRAGRHGTWVNSIDGNAGDIA